MGAPVHLTPRVRIGGPRRSRSGSPASKASPAPVVSLAGNGRVATSKVFAAPAASSRWTDAPCAPRFTTTTGARVGVPAPSSARSSTPSSAASSVAVARSTSGPDRPDEPEGGLPAIGHQRADRGEVEADRRPGRPGQADRLAAGRAERLAQERIGRQVQQVGPVEPGRIEIARAEPIGRPAVRHERPLAVARDDDPDTAGRPAGDPARPHHHVLGSQRPDQGPAWTVPTHGADQLGRRSEAAEPAGRVRRRAALAQPDRARHVGSDCQGTARPEHHVEGQVAQDHDPGDRARARPGAAGQAPGNADPVRHRARIPRTDRAGLPARSARRFR